jgi:hypothetical protein
MGKFIITEEEKNRIKGLYEQTTTGTTQQSQNRNHNELVNKFRLQPKNIAEVKGQFQGMKPEYNRLYVRPDIYLYVITDDKVENCQILDNNTKTFGNSMKVSDLLTNPVLNLRR